MASRGFPEVLEVRCLPAVLPAAGLVSWFRAEGNANDFVDGNNGTLQGGATFETSGAVGQAFRFDGADDFVEVADNANLDITGDLTIEAWIFQGPLDDQPRQIVAKRSVSGAEDVNINLFLQPDGRLAWASRAGGGAFETVETSASVPLGEFSHVAATIQGTTLTLYINGTAATTATLATARPANDGPLTIGGTLVDSALSAPFEGGIDELSIYNQALSAEQIQGLSDAGSEGKATVVVTTTVDENDGSRDPSLGTGTSLREAIIFANSSAGRDVIGFDLPGNGVQTINVGSIDQTPLPAITQSLVIDGYTQRGASPNTNAIDDLDITRRGFNGTLLVELNGASVFNGNDPDGLRVLNGISGFTIKGLVINRFPRHGINIPGLSQTRIEGNFIGLTADGTTAARNEGDGIFVGNNNVLAAVGGDELPNQIGGTAPSARNVISGNRLSGINLQDRVLGLPAAGETGRDVVQGNFIGTNAAGTAAVGNGTGDSNSGGIVLGASQILIGGLAPGQRNVISGNSTNGIINSSGQTGNVSGNTIQGNYIGTDVTGTLDLGNFLNGITSNDPLTITDNLISGNNQNGVFLRSFSGIVLRRNRIGTQADGISPLANSQNGVGNSQNGVLVATPSGVLSLYTIGGTVASDANVIAFNGGSGVSIQEGRGIAIRRNSIFGNGGLGIDLSPALGVTVNNIGDAVIGDPNGSGNSLLNFPVLETATVSGGNLMITGFARPGSVIDLFIADEDPTGFGEGRTYLATLTEGSVEDTDATTGTYGPGLVNGLNQGTDTTDRFQFTIPLPAGVSGGTLLTATATDVSLFDHDNNPATADVPRNNTSEFSGRVTVAGSVNQPPAITSNDGGDSASVNVPENSTFVTDVEATDPNGSALTFTISGGADAGAFSLNPTTGVLTFNTAPNFESPASNAGNNVYDVIVEVSDGELTDTQTIAVTVTNVAPATPTDGNDAADSVAENAQNGALVGITATSTDPAGGLVTFSLTDDAGGWFAILDSTTGVVTVANAGLLVANASHSITVQASDGNLTSTANFTINVGPPNDPPTITSNDGGDSASVNVPENSTAVTDVDATDPNVGSTLTYQIIGGADAARFSIVIATGVLTFRTVPNFESPADTDGNNVYEVIVEVSDGNLADTQEIAVTVTNVAPSTPTDGDDEPDSVPDSAANGALVGIDVASLDPAGGTVTFSLTDDAGGLFAILDSTTGVVTVANAGLLVAGTRSITVQASDGNLASTANFTINVTAPNRPPVITSNGGDILALISVPENTAAVTDVDATDLDAGAVLTFDIIGGVDAAQFLIDPSTGELTFNPAPDFETPTDVGMNNVYDVIVQVSDGSLTDTQAISVTVTNVNEPPTITTNGGEALSLTIAENTMAVTTVAATGQDAGSSLRFSLSGPDAAQFSIHLSSGLLEFVTGANFEAPTDADGDNVYEIVVQVSDGTLAATQAIAVTVTNVNESPTITSNDGGATATISVSEDTTAVTTVTATDPDAGATLTFDITGGADRDRFSIDPASGVLTFVTAPDFENPTDAGRNNVYDVIVQVSDGTLTDTQAIAVAVTHQDAPSAPTDGNAAANSVVERASNGTAVGITARSTSPTGGSVTFTLTDNAGGRFRISSSGVVTVANGTLLNFATATSHQITVQAKNNRNRTSVASFTINVTSGAPTVPTDSNNAADSVNENAANGTAVGIRAKSTSPTGGRVTFSLIDHADRRFAINSSTGVVTVANRSLLNFESAASHQITVQARNNRGLTSTAKFTINVTNVAPSVPTDTNTEANSVAENAANETPVGITAAATDPAGGPVTYRLTDNAGGRFAIDSTTGVVKVANGSLLNFAMASSHQITVEASDGNLTSSANFTINVGDVDLRVAIVANPSAVHVEEKLIYVVTVSKIGASPVNGVMLRVTLPAGVTFVSATDGARPQNRVLTYNLRDLPSNFKTITILVIPPRSAIPAGRTNAKLTLQANILSNGLDIDRTNNSATLDTEVIQAANLELTQLVATSTVRAGQDPKYRLTVTNRGPHSATGVTLFDTLPVGMTFVSATEPATQSGNTLRFDLGTIANGARRIIEIVARPTGSLLGRITNEARVFAPEDFQLNNNIAQANITVLPGADLRLMQSPSLAPVRVGDDVLYTVTVHNRGPNTATNVRLTDRLSGSSSTLLMALPTSTADIEPGQTRTLQMLVNARAVGTLTNTVTVTATEEINTVGNQSALSLSVLNAPNFSVLMQAGQVPATVIAGQDLRFAFQVSNTGTVDATDVTVTIPRPAGAAFVLADGSLSTANLSLNLGAVRSRAQQGASVTIRPQIAGSLDINIAASSAETNFVPPSAQSQIVRRTFVLGPSFLTQATPERAAFGQELTYRIQVSNAGPAAATGAIATVQLPAGAAFLSAGPGTFSQPSQNVLSYNLDSLAVGAASSFDVVVRAPDEAPVQLVSNALPTLLQVTALPGVPSGAAFEDLVYAFNVTNVRDPNDPEAPTISERLTFELPTGAELVGVNAAGRVSAIVNQRFTFDPTALRPGDSTTVEVRIRTPRLQLAVEVASLETGGIPTANSRATLATTVSLPPDLELILGPLVNPIASFQEVIYTATIRNNGAGPATGVTLIENFSVSGSGQFDFPDRVSQDLATAMLRFDLGLLRPGASITVPLKVLPRILGTLSVAASVTADQQDARPADNSDQIDTTYTDLPPLIAVGLGGVGDSIRPALQSQARIFTASGAPRLVRDPFAPAPDSEDKIPQRFAIGRDAPAGVTFFNSVGGPTVRLGTTALPNNLTTRRADDFPISNEVILGDLSSADGMPGLYAAAADFNGDDVADDFVIGADLGADPRVRYLARQAASARNPLPTSPNFSFSDFSFLAYPRTFRGGVRVASADIDGDGIIEVITAPGPSRNPASGAPLAPTQASHPLAPNVRSDMVATNVATPVVINVLFNDDPPRQGELTARTLSVETQPRNGTAERNPDDTITYTPDPGFEGDVDSFTYRSTNGDGFALATVLVRVVPDIKVFRLQDLDFGNLATQVQTPVLSFHPPLVLGPNGAPAFEQPGYDIAAGVANQATGAAGIVLGVNGTVLYYDVPALQSALQSGTSPSPAFFSPYLYPSGGVFDGEVRVAFADMNNDGFAEIITGNGPGIPNEVRIYDRTAGTAAGPLLLNNFFITDVVGDDGLHGIYVAAIGPT